MIVVSTVISERVRRSGSQSGHLGKTTNENREMEETIRRRRGKGEIKGLISDFYN
jgi:hypothetical protein